MKCPSCGHLEDKVIDSRSAKEGQAIRRRRECLKCQRRFTTYETVETTPLLVIKKDGRREQFSREKILNSIWGYEYPIETRVIDVHIRNLRRKIETQPSRPYYILAVPGIGYRFTNARPA